MAFKVGDRFRAPDGRSIKVLKADPPDYLVQSKSRKGEKKTRVNEVQLSSAIRALKMKPVVNTREGRFRKIKWGSDSQPFWYPGPNPAVDIVVTREGPQGTEILLIKRPEGSVEGGKWALPGGHHDSAGKKGQPWKSGRETSLEAAIRELREETTLDLSSHENLIRRIGHYDTWGRDPRDNRDAWAVTTVFYADVDSLGEDITDDVGVGDAKEVKQIKWMPLNQTKRLVLAFDHDRLITDALDKVDSDEEESEEDELDIPDTIDTAHRMQNIDLIQAVKAQIKSSNISGYIQEMLKMLDAYLKGRIGQTVVLNAIMRALSVTERLYAISRKLLRRKEKAEITTESRHRESLGKLYTRLTGKQRKGVGITPPLVLLRQALKSRSRQDLYEMFSELMQTLLTVRDAVEEGPDTMSEDWEINHLSFVITEDPCLFEFDNGLPPEDRAKLHRRLARGYRSKSEKEIMRLVKNKIIDGSSDMSGPLEDGEFSMDDVIDAIKAKRCLGATEMDLGHSYIKNLVGNVIHDIFPIQSGTTRISINRARKVFGLEPLKGKKRKKKEG